jgi:hypothetical protein
MILVVKLIDFTDFERLLLRGSRDGGGKFLDRNELVLNRARKKIWKGFKWNC